MEDKKAISGIVAISLLLVVSVIAVTYFNVWYNDFLSKSTTQIEENSPFLNLKILSIDSENLYFIQPNSSNFKIEKILIKDSNSNEVCSMQFELSKNELRVQYDFEYFNSSNYTFNLKSEKYPAKAINLSRGKNIYDSYIVFNGINSYLYLGNDTFDYDPDDIPEGTLSFDIQTNQASESDILNFEGWIWIRKMSDGRINAITDGSGSNILNSTTLINDNKWHNIMVSWNDSQSWLYIDGVLEDTISAAKYPQLWSTNRSLIVGSVWDLTNNFYMGKIANFKLFDWNIVAKNSSTNFIYSYLGFKKNIFLNLPSKCSIQKKLKYQVCFIYNKGVSCTYIIAK